ncbi:MAG: T9SS type A sorting domain-containing protein [Saprospiraceae bacterium]|jgi:hypothetical protein|nr:T9SS type A sorting domain-containing protein [Saprospiraceae bacterium]
MKTLYTSYRLFHLVILLLIADSLPAQNIRFSFTNGNTEFYPLHEVRKITFSGTVLNLHLNAGITESWDVSTISNYSFDNTVGLPETASGAVLSDVQVFPNPSSGAVTISYTLQKPGNVTLEIYDLQGKLVKQVLSTVQQTGKQQQNWNATDDTGRAVSPGHYVCRLSVGGHTYTESIIIQ